MKIFNSIIIVLSIALMSCGGWTDARKQKVLDKCENDTFDCDCFLTTTVTTFQDTDIYTSTMENESVNQDAVDAYWDNIYESCLKD